MKFWHKPEPTPALNEFSGEYVLGLSDHNLLHHIERLMTEPNEYSWFTGKLLTTELMRRTFITTRAK